ncbi:PDR/VanB family oxidoreductase [Rosenbergiella australiborealis]|uniref:PDR/VanB family oxidoreductase n=1 Tax=Rosenbergiella australiborealis TaxID=1544696 RepID=UPI001F4E89FA|nr:PDR/VanB family oxidoreductase [Rosenbergiella australiborealis]
MEQLSVIVESLCLQGTGNLAVSLQRPTPGEPLPEWQAGAHIDVHLAPGLIRQYSLTGSDEDRHRYHICVALDAASRGGSRYIHQQLRPGDRLTISPPRNLFALQPAKRVVLIAAGIGITPLYAMALQLEKQGIAFTLHYYCRRAEQAAYRQALSGDWHYGRCHLWYSDKGNSPRQHIAADVTEPQDDTLIYLCGPEGFMQHQQAVALAYGWPAQAIYTEAFKPAALTEQSGDKGSFMITLASTGQQWPVAPSQTIAEVLIEQGVSVPLSCEMGMCGACLTGVTAGVVDHRDTVQSEEEKTAARQQIALCCSRSHSDVLVLDL